MSACRYRTSRRSGIRGAVPVIAVLLAALMLTACGKKDVSVYDIEGTWETVAEGRVVTLTSVYTFRSDMTYTRSSVSASDVVSIGSESEGSFTLSGRTITIKDDFDEYSYQVSFRDGNMIFTADNGAERVFARK